jgi:hypothetical protein
MKALVGENDDRILGFTMIGATAGEVMAAVQTAMIAGLPYSRLANAALAHPTMAEGLNSSQTRRLDRFNRSRQKEPHRQRISRSRPCPCNLRVVNNVIVQAASGASGRPTQSQWM